MRENIYADLDKKVKEVCEEKVGSSVTIVESKFEENL